MADAKALRDVAQVYTDTQSGDVLFLERAGVAGQFTWDTFQAQPMTLSDTITASGTINVTGTLQLNGTDIQTDLDKITRQVTPVITAGTNTAFTATAAPTITALTSGLTIRVRWHSTSGTDPTLDVSGLGAAEIRYFGGGGSPIRVPSALLNSQQINTLQYDGTYWIVLDPSAGRIIDDTSDLTQTPAGLAPRSAIDAAIDAAIQAAVPGEGQTWADVKSQRSLGVWHTNSGTKAIRVVINIRHNGGSDTSSYFVSEDGGSTSFRISFSEANEGEHQFREEIQPGESYMAQASLATVTTWTQRG